MASNIDERQLLVWFLDSLLAISYVQASGSTTNNAVQVTAQANQNTADTALTSTEKAIATAISSGFVSAVTGPSSSIKGSTGL